jgi:phosphatidylinositol-3-phosphatase
MKPFTIIMSLMLIILSACSPAAEISRTLPVSSPSTGTPQTAPALVVPDFAHIVIIPFENREFDQVIGNSQMPNYNLLAGEYTLLSQYFTIRHPSLPNYIALVGGDTFGISKDCTTCYINAPSLADQIESSGRSWKAYLEGMPSDCFIGNHGEYVQKHNPFIYFDPIRLDATRCKRSIVPFTDLSSDLASGSLPNFAYIMPNLCDSAHDANIRPLCSLDTADDWLGYVVPKLQNSLDATGKPYLIVVTWDEGTTTASCCGLSKSAGGRVATLLISPQVRNGFQDTTPYTIYSMLKTIETAWNLPLLGHAADGNNSIIIAPWK